jgi:23S rRNA (adenine2503-C2)-methyltransferase
VNLAISLHAADDELRQQLVPLNRRYPIEELIEAAAGFFAAKGRRISLEWTLIDGVNDDEEQAFKLAEIADRLRAHVNVIALNPTPLTTDRPSPPEAVGAFMAVLRRSGANATLRDTRGQDIDAACGQLRVHQAAAGRA